jgi:hypothetical protein
MIALSTPSITELRMIPVAGWQLHRPVGSTTHALTSEVYIARTRTAKEKSHEPTGT